MKEQTKEAEIDLMQLFRALLKKAWLLLLTAAVFAAVTLVYTRFCITPLYTARTLMYVNNRALSIGDTRVGISQGDLVASQSLVDTYTIILKTRTTLQDVIEKADLPYNYEQLTRMIRSDAVDNTEIFYIEVTSPSPGEAEKIANTIGQILPEKIASIVEGSSARIVDYAVVPARKSSPSLEKNTILGGLAGFLLACGAVVILQMQDNRIHSSDYLIQTYELPVLAVIPNLSGHHGSGEYGYGYGHRPTKEGKQDADKV